MFCRQTIKLVPDIIRHCTELYIIQTAKETGGLDCKKLSFMVQCLSAVHVLT